MKYSDIGSAMKARVGAVGLRGDFFLYRELETLLLKTEIPTEAKFETVMYRAFEELTQISIDTTGYVHIEKYSHGGLSSGMVSPEIWKHEVIPQLKNIIYSGC